MPCCRCLSNYKNGHTNTYNPNFSTHSSGFIKQRWYEYSHNRQVTVAILMVAAAAAKQQQQQPRLVFMWGGSLLTCVCVMQLLSMMAQSSEFGQMAIREEELPELDALARDACHFDIKGGPENKHGKVNILLQVSVGASAQVLAFIPDAGCVVRC